MVVEIRGKKQSMRLNEISRLHVFFFSPRSIFDLVTSGQRQNFREKLYFLDFHAYSGVSMCRSDLKPSPACSLFSAKQDRVLLLYPVAKFSIRSAPKSNGITLAGCHRRNGQNSNWSNDDDWPRGCGRSGLETFLGTMNHRFRFSTSGNPTKHMPIGYLSFWVQPRSVTSGHLSWPWNSSGAMSRVTSGHVLTPISTTIPIQVNRTTPSCVYSRFRWNLDECCSSYDVITSWPDLTWPIFFTKSCAKDAP